ncbi:MAG: efflux RND transporter periplasmic adaptor subunit, partial [Lachnospiraceae bacterium]|nr:efflux RND transporter periplasmic adaptor subunit [Lachnospiraceae bacterium]
KEIEAAFIQYDTARKSFERMRKLYQSGDISLQNYESVKAQYDAAKLQYDTKVEYSTPVAVGDGVVENTNMTINTSIKVETVLCYITSEDSKEINFGVTERVLNGLKLGDKVTIEKSGKTYDGYISNIANLINTSNGLFNVKAVITSENNFASGIIAKVSFVYEKKKNVNILPNEMIYYEAGNPYLFIVDSKDIVRKMYIDVGIENETTSEILTDIDKNVKIVSTWNNDLADGTTVKVVKDEEVYDEIDLENEVNEKLDKNDTISTKSILSFDFENISSPSTFDYSTIVNAYELEEK